MSRPVPIREATPRDAEAISALVGALARYFLADPQDPDAARAFFVTATPEAIRGYLHSGRYVYHVAEANGAVVGAVGVRDGRHLYHLFVAERMHRRGLAARLWATARDRAERDGAPGPYTVNASVFVIPVYRRFGFVEDGPLLEKDGIRYQPMVLEVGGARTEMESEA